MVLEDLDLPVKIADVINKVLDFIGITLPLYMTQAFALILFLAGFIYFLVGLIRQGTQSLTRLLTTIAFGLIAAAILIWWGMSIWERPPLEITGTIQVLYGNPQRERFDIRVQLLDFRKDNISMNEGYVDTCNGAFAVPYRRVFGDYPRHVRVTHFTYGPKEFLITRSQLLAGTVGNLSYACGGPK